MKTRLLVREFLDDPWTILLAGILSAIIAVMAWVLKAYDFVCDVVIASRKWFRDVQQNKRVFGSYSTPSMVHIGALDFSESNRKRKEKWQEFFGSLAFCILLPFAAVAVIILMGIVLGVC